MADVITDRDILTSRRAKNVVHPRRPYAFITEPEYAASGEVVDVATLFLTNKECPFRCLMCDLWQNTTDTSVAPGDIPTQIIYALNQLPPAQHIKLYNSGNFFDTKAIPPADYPDIAQLVSPFERVIIENHPKLTTSKQGKDLILSFRDMVDGQLEVALGLETVHPDVLQKLNKRMTLDDFTRATDFLRSHEIDVRTFILLRPPFMTEEEGVEWAIKSIEFAFEVGVQCCAVVPTRAGNGMIDQLAQQGHFTPPQLLSMERVLDAGLQMSHTIPGTRVFMDLWDVEQFYPCHECGPSRKTRMNQMNLTQKVLPGVKCNCT